MMYMQSVLGIFLLAVAPLLVVALPVYAQESPFLIVNSDTSSNVPFATGAVELLFDSDSYTPPFYRGRALPSAGTNLHLQAIPRFGSPRTLTYTWKRNSVVLGSISGIGKSSVTIPAPDLFGTDTISVDVSSQDNTERGGASVTISSKDPVLVLYEDQPLFGIRLHRALAPQDSVRDVETTFAAIPYFARTQSPNDSHFSYAWTVNGQVIAPNQKTPSEITINAKNSTGRAQISLDLTSSADILMQSHGSWTVTFGSGGSTQTSVSPFTNPAQ